MTAPRLAAVLAANVVGPPRECMDEALPPPHCQENAV
jgi:hypothetical protein